jgi:hypothetical protein
MDAEVVHGPVPTVRANAVPRARPAEEYDPGSGTEDVHERTLWPEFLALSKELGVHLDELTDRVIREAIHDDVTEAPEATTKALPAPPAFDAATSQASSASTSEDGSKSGSPT